MLFRGVLSLCALLIGSVTAVAALNLTRVTTPSFGVMFAGDSSRQFVLNTNDTVTGSGARDYISGAVAGQFTVSGTSSPAAINILVDNIISLGGLTVNQALCSYNDGAQQSCDVETKNVKIVSTSSRYCFQAPPTIVRWRVARLRQILDSADFRWMEM